MRVDRSPTSTCRCSIGAGRNGLAAHVLLTKADKLSRGEAGTVLKQVRAEVAGVATAQLFSAVAKTGVDEARREVLGMLNADAAKKSPVAP